MFSKIENIAKPPAAGRAQLQEASWRKSTHEEFSICGA